MSYIVDLLTMNSQPIALYLTEAYLICQAVRYTLAFLSLETLGHTLAQNFGTMQNHQKCTKMQNKNVSLNRP